MSFSVKQGSRLSVNLIKISMMGNGQFRITIPSKIARRLSLAHGDVVHVEELMSGGFSVRKVDIIKDGEIK